MNLQGILRRVEERLDAVGLSASAASKAAGKPEAIRNLQRAVRDGKRQGITTATLEALAPVLKTSVGWLMDGDNFSMSPKVLSHSLTGRKDLHPDDGLDIRGDVACGVWMEIDAHADAGGFDKAPIVYSPDWPREAQYALRVRGSSINRRAIDGDLLRCIDIGLSGITPLDGDLVIVEQRRADGLREVTAKVISRAGAIIQLAPDSTDEKWKPIILDTKRPSSGVEIAIIAVVDYMFRPMRRR